jgi:hypothetical protein
MRRMGSALQCALAVAGLCVLQASRAQGGSDTADIAAPATVVPGAVPHVSTRAASRVTLERRVAALSKALQLDTHQRAQLLVILEVQRAEVAKIWSDPAIAPAERAPVTRAVEERTADQIRGILSDNQKNRYNLKKPQSAQSSPPDVGKWMELTRNSTQGAAK